MEQDIVDKADVVELEYVIKMGVDEYFEAGEGWDVRSEDIEDMEPCEFNRWSSTVVAHEP